ncbi:MAG: tRNA (adenosine(37)-N6)-dimethylallyltransferase MiaA [Actinomycetota bacterium]|nr:tRNA (adenosine(37)-N6)-dimethylallyltransferase MiaA [Actinomycetota bacterium]
MISVAAIVGPTAVGKTELAARIAADLGSEVVSIDSMQAYRGLDVGTAKPPTALREKVAHHMIDVFDPHDDITVAEFRDRARDAIADVAGRGHTPLLVGGSGLYFRAVVDDLAFPPRADEVRERLEAECEEVGAEALYERLQRLDARAAARIEPQNARRTIRALEVIELTGEPFSAPDAWDRYESIYDLRVVGITIDRVRLYENIARRVDDMIELGLVQEALELDREGLGRTARQALGYRQVLDVTNPTDTESIRGAIVRATKRFARRQESWFRADPRVRWLDADDPDVAETAVQLFAGARVERT